MIFFYMVYIKTVKDIRERDRGRETERQRETETETDDKRINAND